MYKDLAGAPPALADVWASYQALLSDGLAPDMATLFARGPAGIPSYLAVGDLYGPDVFELNHVGPHHSAFENSAPPQGRGQIVHHAKGIRRQSAERAWIAVSHPCGYLSRRRIRRISGNTIEIVETFNLSLPLASPAPSVKRIMNYGTQPVPADNIALHDPDALVQSVELLCWMDIGFGRPDSAS